MNFNSVSVVKHPIDRVWTIMRDDLPNLMDLLEDIEGITVELYEKKEHICKVVNIWKASPPLPQSIASRVAPDMFVWTDSAEWNEKKMECRWSIELHHFRDRVHCSGTTKFDTAMGGRSTKITFSGNIEWINKNTSSITNFLEETIYHTIEPLIKNLIPRNFRKITMAITKRLDANSGTSTKNHAGP